MGTRFSRQVSAPESPVRRFSIRLDNVVGFAAISPDGRHIVYTTPPEDTLWVQDLDRNEPRKLATAGFNRFPFWSPDSAFVGLRSAEGRISKVSVDGGPLVTVCETEAMAFEQPTWSPDGKWIVFAAGSPSRLYEVPASGGTPKLLFQPDTSESTVGFKNAHFLPNDRERQRLLYDMDSGGASRIVAQEIDTGRRSVLASGSRPFYSQLTGHILYEAAGDLWAMPFSASTSERTGEPFPVSPHTSTASVARDGTLVYLASEGGLEQLVWRNRQGIKLGSIGQPQNRIELPRLSPDSRRVVAVGKENAGPFGVWIHETARGSKIPFAPHPAEHDRPIWTPQADAVTFTSARNGNPDIFLQRLDSTADPQTLVNTPDGDYPYDWSADGKHLVFARCRTNCHLWYLTSKEGETTHEIRPFIQSRFNDFSASFSPDSKYLAYASDESGRLEVYVQRFPEGGSKTAISTNGGVGPRWREDGKELFYTEGDWMVAVSITPGPAISVGVATRLFQDRNRFETRSLRYDVTPDGQRFVFPELVEEPRPAIRVVQNWFAEFRDRQQSSRRAK